MSSVDLSLTFKQLDCILPLQVTQIVENNYPNYKIEIDDNDCVWLIHSETIYLWNYTLNEKFRTYEYFELPKPTDLLSVSNSDQWFYLFPKKSLNTSSNSFGQKSSMFRNESYSTYQKSALYINCDGHIRYWCNIMNRNNFLDYKIGSRDRLNCSKKLSIFEIGEILLKTTNDNFYCVRIENNGIEVDFIDISTNSGIAGKLTHLISRGFKSFLNKTTSKDEHFFVDKMNASDNHSSRNINDITMTELNFTEATDDNTINNCLLVSIRSELSIYCFDKIKRFEKIFSMSVANIFQTNFPQFQSLFDEINLLSIVTNDCYSSCVLVECKKMDTLRYYAFELKLKNQLDIQFSNLIEVCPNFSRVPYLKMITSINLMVVTDGFEVYFYHWNNGHLLGHYIFKNFGVDSLVIALKVADNGLIIHSLHQMFAVDVKISESPPVQSQSVSQPEMSNRKQSSISVTSQNDNQPGLETAIESCDFVNNKFKRLFLIYLTDKETAMFMLKDFRKFSCEMISQSLAFISNEITTSTCSSYGSTLNDYHITTMHSRLQCHAEFLNLVCNEVFDGCNFCPLFENMEKITIAELFLRQKQSHLKSEFQCSFFIILSFQSVFEAAEINLNNKKSNLLQNVDSMNEFMGIFLTESIEAINNSQLSSQQRFTTTLISLELVEKFNCLYLQYNIAQNYPTKWYLKEPILKNVVDLILSSLDVYYSFYPTLNLKSILHEFRNHPSIEIGLEYSQKIQLVIRFLMDKLTLRQQCAASKLANQPNDVRYELAHKIFTHKDMHVAIKLADDYEIYLLIYKITKSPNSYYDFEYYKNKHPMMVPFIQNFLIKKRMWKDLEPHIDVNNTGENLLVKRIPEAMWIYNYKNNAKSEVSSCLQQCADNTDNIMWKKIYLSLCVINQKIVNPQHSCEDLKNQLKFVEFQEMLLNDRQTSDYQPNKCLSLDELFGTFVARPSLTPEDVLCFFALLSTNMHSFETYKNRAWLNVIQRDFDVLCVESNSSDGPSHTLLDTLLYKCLYLMKYKCPELDFMPNDIETIIKDASAFGSENEPKIIKNANAVLHLLSIRYYL